MIKNFDKESQQLIVFKSLLNNSKDTVILGTSRGEFAIDSITSEKITLEELNERV